MIGFILYLLIAVVAGMTVAILLDYAWDSDELGKKEWQDRDSAAWGMGFIAGLFWPVWITILLALALLYFPLLAIYTVIQWIICEIRNPKENV